MRAQDVYAYPKPRSDAPGGAVNVMALHMSGYRLRCRAAARSVRWTGAASDRALPLRRRHLCHLCLLCLVRLHSAWRHVRSANSRPFSSQADRGLPQASTRSTAPTQLVISELGLGKLSGQCPITQRLPRWPIQGPLHHHKSPWLKEGGAGFDGANSHFWPTAAEQEATGASL